MVKQFKNQAAVLICIAETANGSNVLLTQRAAHLKSHAGEVALPGGKWEVGDLDLLATAQREAREEVGLNPSDISNIHAMESRSTRQGVLVTPFFGKVAADISLTPCAQELASLFWMPLDVIQEDRRSYTDIFEVGGTVFWAPAYEFENYLVWGFTARLLVDFVNQFHGGAIGRPHSSPEKIHRQKKALR